MRIAFAGLRHDHIFWLLDMVKQSDDYELAGWWEEEDAAREAAQMAFPMPPYASYAALLADETVEAVAIGDYYGIRGQRIIAALKAGKHVISDKPLCTSIEELNEIEQFAYQSGRKVGCMLDLRYDPAIRQLSQLIADGILGEIKSGAFTGQHPLNYGTRPGWYFEDGKHGGTFNDIAIHGVDAIAFLTGCAWTQVRYAREWNAFAAEEPNFKDSAQCVGELANGANIMADVSYAAPAPVGFRSPAYWRFTLWGTGGFAECRCGDPSITLMLTGDNEPHIITALPVTDTCLTDFLKDAQGQSTPFDTKRNLQSSRAALDLQLNAK